MNKMKTGAVRIALAAVVAAAGLIGASAVATHIPGAATRAVAGAVETAKVVVVGQGTVGPEKSPRNASGQVDVREGDVIRLAGAADRATITFADGSRIDLVGPATLRMVQIQNDGRRVQLLSGSITEARIGGIACEVQTPYDASLVLQDAVAFARVAPGDKVLFQKRQGDYARVHQGSTATDLRGEPWVANVRTGTATTAAPSAAQKAQIVSLPGDRAHTLLGHRVVAWEPASKFEAKIREDGGLDLCFGGGGPKSDDWGVVYVGSDTVLFLAPGQCVQFDAQGNVTRFDGIVHMYHPLGEMNWDEPVENAADASISYSSRR